MRFHVVAVCLLLTAHIAKAQSIPSDRIFDWSKAGFSGSFSKSASFIDITDLGAANDSSAAIDTYVQQAIDSFKGRSGIIYFPPGKYLLNSPLYLPDSLVLKGAGSDSSKLVFDLGAAPDNCINISEAHPESSDPFTKIISGTTKGSSTLVLNSASGFSAGDYAEIRQDNGGLVTVPIGYAEKCIGQMVKIKSVTGNILLIEPSLRMDFDTSLNAQVRKIRPVTHAGIECLHIVRADSPVSASVYNIYFQFAVDCKVSGIESSKSMGAHIMIEYSKNITVSGSYIHHSFGYDGSGTRGYGICLRQHTSDCLIENNTLRFLRHALMVKEGANGNVFGYNYSFEPNRSEPIPDFSGDISLHGHYAFANLFEGNIVQNIIIDHYWGTSGSYNTFFRNRAEGYGILMTDAAPFTADQNFAGNEVTNTTPLHGNYILKGIGHFEYGNSVKGIITPAGDDSLTAASLYLSAKPFFWDIGPWPAIGFPNTPGSGSIPAKQRYAKAGVLTVCAPAAPTIIVPVTISHTASIKGPYPNPASGQVFFEMTVPGQSVAEMAITDLPGRLIMKQTIHLLPGKNVAALSLPDNMKAGIYIVSIKCGQEISFYKFLKNENWQ